MHGTSGQTGENMPQSLEGQAIKLRAILESAIDAIITIDADGIIETVNPAAEALFRYPRDEFVGRNVHFLMPEPYHSEHDGYIRNYRATGIKRIIGIGRQVIGRRADGTTFPMHLSVSEFYVDGVPHFTGVIHDITAQVEAEQALRHAQKLDAMGQLTGGIAHDFNNLLTVIVGNLEMLEAKLTEPAQRELLTEALEAADLGSRLTSRLLAFARRSLLEPKVVDLNMLVAGLTDMLHRTLGETVALSTALTPDLGTTRVDPAQVESAIINLAVNARDAMPGGGRLVLETRNTVIDEAYAATEAGLAPGEYVQLSVSDTGSGMPAAVRERAFEPFFTTKEKGRGTGLGLSMVYGFAKQSGGHATIYSEEGIGTTVNVYLPRYAAAPPTVSAADERTASANGETILVVEDDDRVRRLTVARLQQLGYRVLEASSAAQALATLEKNDRIDLVFTDLVMPGGMSGSELAIEVRQLHPSVRLLLTSGYAEELANSDRMNAMRLKVLRKPYRQTELARAIDETLHPS
jgi:PAS domain S-box-containing protein